MSATSTPEPVQHKPQLPTDADLEELNSLYGAAEEALQLVVFRMQAYTRPHFEKDGNPDPNLPRPTFADLGRLTLLIEYLKLDRYAIEEEVSCLHEGVSNLIEIAGGDFHV